MLHLQEMATFLMLGKLCLDSKYFEVVSRILESVILFFETPPKTNNSDLNLPLMLKVWTSETVYLCLLKKPQMVIDIQVLSNVTLVTSLYYLNHVLI